MKYDGAHFELTDWQYSYIKRFVEKSNEFIDKQNKPAILAQVYGSAKDRKAFIDVVFVDHETAKEIKSILEKRKR